MMSLESMMERQSVEPSERLSAKAKTRVVLRLLSGEPLDVLGRELKLPTHELESWRREFLDAGAAQLGRAAASPDPDDAATAVRGQARRITMREPRVVFRQGAFLVPQLFQSLSRFVEEDVSARTLLSRFEPWGVHELEIDEGALANRRLVVRRCSGVLPDGLAFSMPGGDPLPLGRDFHALFPHNASSLDVSLALPERRPGERNFAFPASGNGAPSLRFVVSDEEVDDEMDGGMETISVARANFRLLFGGESADGLTVLPIARIRRDEGAYHLDREYIPPCVNAACAPHFWDDALGALLESLVFVSQQLLADRSQRSELIADFGDSDIQRFWVLHLVNRAIPELQHVLRIGHAHPEDLYRFLLRLGGALCTFSPEYSVTAFPPYDHRDLGACLVPATLQIRGMLDTMTFRKRRCVAINLVRGDSSRDLRATLPPQLADAVRENRAELYLAVQEEPGSRPMAADDKVLKVLGRETVGEAETSAGLELHAVSQAPADCARRERTAYFRLVQPTRLAPGRTYARGGLDADLLPRRYEVWEDILRHGEIRVYHLDPAAPGVQLLVVLPQAR